MSAPSFPNESTQYREARDALRNAEAELRSLTERVAAQRRALPLGGEVPEDYVFRQLDAAGQAEPVALSALFAPGKDTLLLYGFMYGAEAERPCPMCTSFLDSLNGSAPHLVQRINLAVVARSPIERVAQFAVERGWQHLRMLSAGDNDYPLHYRTEDEQGRQWPLAHVFVRREGKVYHHWGSELFFDVEPGAQARHVDPLWPLWNVLDLTPEGRGGDWYPALRYE